MENKIKNEWIELPPGVDVEKFLKLKPGDQNALIRLSAVFKNQTGRTIRDAVLFGVALAVVIVVMQFGFYKAGLVGVDFLSVRMQVNINPVPVVPADQRPNDGGNSGWR